MELTRLEILEATLEDVKYLHKRYEILGLEQSMHMTADMIVQLKTLIQLEKAG